MEELTNAGVLKGNLHRNLCIYEYYSERLAYYTATKYSDKEMMALTDAAEKFAVSERLVSYIKNKLERPVI